MSTSDQNCQKDISNNTENSEQQQQNSENLSSEQIEIGEEEINIKETENLKKTINYQKFLEWSFKNGVKVYGIELPVAFGPLGITGVAATQDIPANTVIALIPNKLIIGANKARQGKLKQVFDENPTLFDSKKHHDAEFNILGLFVLYEHLQGEKSFYEPYLSSVGKSYTLFDWTKFDVRETEDHVLIDEFKYYTDEMMGVWLNMKLIIDKYPQFFPPGKITSKIFFWAYELVVTRCFGWSLKYTSVIPFADMFNHNVDTATHYLLDKKVEVGQKEKQKQYKLKNSKINLKIFKEDQEQSVLQSENNNDNNNNKTNQENIENSNYYYKSERVNYINKQKHYLEDLELENNKNLETLKYEDLTCDEEIKYYTYEINYKLLVLNKEWQIWDLHFYTTTDSEDNDTEEDEEEARKKEITTIKDKEIEQIENKQKYDNLKKIKQFEEKNQQQQNQNQKQQFSEEIDDSNFKQNNQKYFAQRIDKQQNNNKNVKKQEEESEEEEESKTQSVNQKRKKENSNIEQDNNQETEQQDLELENYHELNLKNEESTSSDSEYDWYDEQDEDIFFAYASTKPIKKGHQVYNHYGRRTNRFLLMWYGFTFENNIYDSYAFRMHMNYKESKFNDEIFEQIVFLKFLYNDDMRFGTQKHFNSHVSIQDITKEFRLKKSEICCELITYLRIFLLQHYKGNDIYDILITIPVSLQYEIFVLQFYLKLVIYLRSLFKTSNEKDQQFLSDTSISYKLRFAVVLRLNHKEILDEQISIASQALNVINRMVQGVSVKESYMENFENYQNYVDLLIDRHKIKNYLVQIKEGLEWEVLK